MSEQKEEDMDDLPEGCANWAEAFRALQEEIRDAFLTARSSANIDGAGCESGDPMDFSRAELEQGITLFEDELYEKDQQTARLTKRVAELEAGLREIEEGSGPFKRDQLAFATGVIEKHQEIARALLSTSNPEATE